jgi:endonuclease YncB( thermonuclease family)
MLRHGPRLPSCSPPLAARPSSADVSGAPTVIDGDTIVVAGERIRLQGIDAPELHQGCTAYEQEWACGRTSVESLREHLRGHQVECVGHPPFVRIRSVTGRKQAGTGGRSAREG